MVATKVERLQDVHDLHNSIALPPLTHQNKPVDLLGVIQVSPGVCYSSEPWHRWAHGNQKRAEYGFGEYGFKHRTQ